MSFRTCSTSRARYVQIGAMAGQDITLPSHALRRTGLTLLGSGVGAVPMAAMLREMPRLLEEAAELQLDFEQVPLQDVSKVWHEKTSKRIVLAP